MYFIFNQMVEFHYIDIANGYRLVKRLAGVSVTQNELSGGRRRQIFVNLELLNNICHCLWFHVFSTDTIFL